MFEPAFTGSGASDCPTASAGEDVTAVVTAAPATGEVWALSMLYVASVIIVPFASGVLSFTTSWSEPEAPAASAPTFQVTTPADSVPPPVADTNVVFAGTVFVTTTVVAPALPVL